MNERIIVLPPIPVGTAWAKARCRVCGGNLWCDPQRGLGPEGSPEWVCLMCGRSWPVDGREEVPLPYRRLSTMA